MDREKTVPHSGTALLADPIYNYIPFTVSEASEKTEKELIDSPWMQRLRRIHQLQSARWVYPSAEHSRFQHCLGTMHMAGRFARHLYPSLKAVCSDAPSFNFFEGVFRIAGLLHDVGHGPYGHFFDDHFLSDYRLTHESLGKEIILRKLGGIIKKIRRSPSGAFEPSEEIPPEYIAFLIKKPPEPADDQKPLWLKFLQQLFSGIYTVDNLDYVRRDAYMTGFSIDIVDIERLMFYSFFSEKGLTLHQSGVSAFIRFLNARLQLYGNVYYHRTGRAIDLHMQEIFKDTMKRIFPYNPKRALDKYLLLNDWSLIQEVEKWHGDADPRIRELGKQWQMLIQRRVKWKVAYSTDLTIDTVQKGLLNFQKTSPIEDALREYLPAKIRNIPFRIDIATQDPRPLNPMAEGNKRVNIYNPSTGRISPEPLREVFKYIPAKVVHCRVFALDHKHDAALAEAAERLFDQTSQSEAIVTNV